MYYGGEFDEKFERYIDGDFKYFDMCSPKNFKLFDLLSMCEDIGMDEDSYDLWFCIPHQPLTAKKLLPLDSFRCELTVYVSCVVLTMKHIYPHLFTLCSYVKGIFNAYHFPYLLYGLTSSRENIALPTISKVMKKDVFLLISAVF